MNRSLWKGPYVSPKLVQNKHKIWFVSRNSEIVPRFLGLTFKIYNGKKYTNLLITENMIGHKFGEFCFTRAIFMFKKKIKKK